MFNTQSNIIDSQGIGKLLIFTFYLNLYLVSVKATRRDCLLNRDDEQSYLRDILYQFRREYWDITALLH